MKIIALSDLHGNLIKINKQSDIVIIAGDWSPLYIQHYYEAMIDWISSQFVPWMSSLPTQYIVFIAGNHDFVCTNSCFIHDLNEILLHNNVLNKIFYLNRNSVSLLNKKIYGIPDTEQLRNWAFSRIANIDYSFNNDIDILITHQPPKYYDLGYVKDKGTDFGSIDLLNSIKQSNVKLCICGHIHTGAHGEHLLKLNNDNQARLYNVSILDEQYNYMFDPTIIEL